MVEEARSDVALFRALSFVSRQLTAAVELGLKESAGISLPEFEILGALSRAPEGRARAGELGEMLAWEKSRISHQVSRMERKGLIARVSCEDDLRGTWVELTEAGARAGDSAMPAYEAAIAQELGSVAATDAGKKLTHQVLAIGASVAPDSCQRELQTLFDAAPEAPGA